MVDAASGHEAHNVLMAVSNPATGNQLHDPRIAAVDEFLRIYAKPLQTVSNTIFPQALYTRHGAPAFFDAFHTKVLPSVRRNERWSGYYFERMTSWPGAPLNNPLWDIVERMRDSALRTRNKFELAVFDPARDVDRSPYGGQCLSHLSFKLLPGSPNTLALTAFYRNHYYIEKLLGNLIGLSNLMAFVAKEAELKLSPLTILSSHAKIDLPKSDGLASTRSDLKALLDRVDSQATEAA